MKVNEAEKNKKKDPRDDLGQFLSEGDHPVEIALRPEKTVKLFREAIDRGYILVKFTDTRGGTELGVRLDHGTTDLNQADFDNQTGNAHLVGGLTLNYVKVQCVADIDLNTLTGQGHLEFVEA
ncbi:MAG: MbtH domain protein [candidate division Zixibacteria bacterium SM23_81]|nr:MAG: MbtH domain protein [candidate division Zixibacteria bacterium SM23_81]